VKIDNGTVKAGTTLTRADTDNTLWTLVVRPAQGRNSGDLKVKVTNLPALTSPLASASIVSVGAAVESSACIELDA
jgi:hypothetical protein